MVVQQVCQTNATFNATFDARMLRAMLRSFARAFSISSIIILYVSGEHFLHVSRAIIVKEFKNG